jgi:predicted phosphodiesterase
VKKGLPRAIATHRIEDHRRTSIFLCHATPSDPLFRYLQADSSQWAAETASVDADAGHTHIPFILQLGDRQVVNPGSASQPKHGVPEVRYALLDDGKVIPKACPYRKEDTIRKVEALPIDERLRQQLANVLRRGSLQPAFSLAR